jgi:hypothetical protein
MYLSMDLDERDGDTDVVDKSVSALIDCGNCYLEEPEIVTMMLSSLMKLTQPNMTTKHT